MVGCFSSRRYIITPAHPTGYLVGMEGEAGALFGPAPYSVACAIARYRNGQDAEPGDLPALVEYCLRHLGAAE